MNNIVSDFHHLFHLRNVCESMKYTDITCCAHSPDHALFIAYKISTNTARLPPHNPPSLLSPSHLLHTKHNVQPHSARERNPHTLLGVLQDRSHRTYILRPPLFTSSSQLTALDTPGQLHPARRARQPEERSISNHRLPLSQEEDARQRHREPHHPRTRDPRPGVEMLPHGTQREYSGTATQAKQSG